MLREMGPREHTSFFVKPLFARWSRIYDAPIFQAYYGRVHDRILALADAHIASALDVGCGTGELLAKLAKRHPEAQLTGVDLSREMLEKARAKPFASRARLLEGSVYQLPLPDASFELVTNTLSSHFYQDFPRALGELARVLRPGGALFMASLGNGPWRHLPGALGRERRFGGVVQRSPRAQVQALEAAGFVVERVEPLMPAAWLYGARRAAGAHGA